VGSPVQSKATPQALNKVGSPVQSKASIVVFTAKEQFCCPQTRSYLALFFW
jgi:hypothetical protein